MTKKLLAQWLVYLHINNYMNMPSRDVFGWKRCQHPSRDSLQALEKQGILRHLVMFLEGILCRVCMSFSAGEVCLCCFPVEPPAILFIKLYTSIPGLVNDVTQVQRKKLYNSCTPGFNLGNTVWLQITLYVSKQWQELVKKVMANY